MLGLLPSWFLFLSAGLVCASIHFYRRQPGTAIGAGLAVSMASATWLAPSIWGEPIDARIAIALLALIVFCLVPDGRFRFHWVWLDTIIGLILIFGIASDWVSEGVSAASACQVYGEWVLPYFTGRFLAMRFDGVRGSAVWFASIGIVLGVGAIFEGFTGINLWEVLFAKKDDLVSHHGGIRYGLLHRATGPTRHSIFLGVVLLLIAPWFIHLLRRIDARGLNVLGGVGFAVLFLGLLSTVSRGPLLCFGIAGAASLAIAWPSTRKWLVGAGAIALVLVLCFWDQALAVIDTTQKAGQVTSKVVNVTGEPELYTSSRNRLWVWKVYTPLVVEGGLLGYGTKAVSSFPPKIPGLPMAVHARETLGVVDNSYLLIGLRYGWIGLSLFVILLAGTIFTSVRLRGSIGQLFYPEGASFLTAMAGVMVGVSVEILTVFSSFEFMFWLQFNCGVVAGLLSLWKDHVKMCAR